MAFILRGYRLTLKLLPSSLSALPHNFLVHENASFTLMITRKVTTNFTLVFTRKLLLWGKDNSNFGKGDW